MTATPIPKRVVTALLVVALLVLGSALPASAQPSPDLVKFQVGDATLGMPRRWAETLFRATTEGHWRDAKPNGAMGPRSARHTADVTADTLANGETVIADRGTDAMSPRLPV